MIRNPLSTLHHPDMPPLHLFLHARKWEIEIQLAQFVLPHEAIKGDTTVIKGFE